MSRTDDACLTFALGDDSFALPLPQVREISAAGRIAQVPLAPSIVKGVINHRGRVITLIDVATLFQRTLHPARFAEDRIAILLAAPYDHLGLYVHAPVEIGHMAARATMTQASGVRARDVAEDSPAGGVATISGKVMNVLSANQLYAHCDAKILELFRRRN